MRLKIIKKKYGAKKIAKCGSFVPEVMKKTDNKSVLLSLTGQRLASISD